MRGCIFEVNPEGLRWSLVTYIVARLGNLYLEICSASFHCLKQKAGCGGYLDNQNSQ